MSKFSFLFSLETEKRKKIGLETRGFRPSLFLDAANLVVVGCVLGGMFCSPSGCHSG